MAKKPATKSEAMQTPVGRVSYPSLAQPSNTFNENKYKITLLIPKENKEVVKIQDAIKKLAKEHFGAKPNKLKELTFPLKDGDKKLLDDGTVDEIYAGHWYLNAHSKKKVPVVDVRKEPLDPIEVYGGCHARAMVVFSSYDQQNGGVTCYLQAVQKIRDDTPFGGSSSYNFDDYEDESEEEESDSTDDDMPF